MWDFIRNIFKQNTPADPENPTQTNIEQPPAEKAQIENGPKDGMPENYWQNEERPPMAANEQPTIAEGRDLGLGRMENSSTTTNEKAVQNIEEKIKSIIEERERTKDMQVDFNQETPTKTWAERFTSKTGESHPSISEAEQPNHIEIPEIGEDTPSGSRDGGGRGGGGTPGKDMDILDGKDDGVDDPDEPLSQNENEVQNPLENLTINDVQPDENSANRLAALFRGDNQELSNDTTLKVEDKSKDLQPDQNDGGASSDAERLAALFRNDNQMSETSTLPEISDDQRSALYLAFNESGSENEIEDYFPVDKSLTEDFANDTKSDIDASMTADGPEMGTDGGETVDIGVGGDD